MIIPMATTGPVSSATTTSFGDLVQGNGPSAGVTTTRVKMCRKVRGVSSAVERYWRKMLSSRSWKSDVRWKAFHRVEERSIAATKAVSLVPGATSSRGAVKLFLTSVVREKLGSFSGDCTLRSVGAGGG